MICRLLDSIILLGAGGNACGLWGSVLEWKIELQTSGYGYVKCKHENLRSFTKTANVSGAGCGWGYGA